MYQKLNGLWHHADFLRLWSGQTVSAFGSMVGRTAMSFTAILFLHATPFQLGLLNAAELAPGFLVGLFAGAWVDRLRRRPMLIAADLARALVLSSIPLAALLGVLHIEQLYAVALLVSILSIIFNVAYQSYLPGLIDKNSIMEANSKLNASAAVAEISGFSIGGWLVQIFTAPFAILIDAISFLVSAISIGLIHAREIKPPSINSSSLRQEIVSGLKLVFQQSLLRAGAVSVLLQNLAGGIFGALVVLYMSRGLGFSPGLLGVIWAVGGLSSFLGAAFTPRITSRLGSGPAMLLGLGVYGISSLFVPLASGATFLSVLFLIIQQLGDGFYILYDINLVSLVQVLVDERMLGRVNATMQIIAIGASLFGALLGGLIGQTIGVRLSLLIAGAGILLAVLVLAFSPLSKLKTALEPASEANFAQ
ncbi:MAG TPA: MFS transporter [Anaerolineaceae bacterium]|nr:MFS transporter [Anaerolineaceae bacterium]